MSSPLSHTHIHVLRMKYSLLTLLLLLSFKPEASASLEDAPHVVSAACVPPLTVTLHSCCIFNLPCGI